MAFGVFFVLGMVIFKAGDIRIEENNKNTKLK